jgi:hypothetical protein
VELNGGGISEEISTMQKHVLMLTASTFILACGATISTAAPTMRGRRCKRLLRARSTARSIGGMLFECAICPAITMLMLIGLVGLLVVLRIQPF